MYLIYERYLKCRKCHQDMRQTAQLPLNKTGESHVNMWLEEFQLEHNKKSKHFLDLEIQPWRRLTYVWK